MKLNDNGGWRMLVALLLTSSTILAGCSELRTFRRHEPIPIPPRPEWCKPKFKDVKGGVFLANSDADSLYISVRDLQLYCDKLEAAVKAHNKAFK